IPTPPADLRKWPMPSARIAAGGFLTIFASGKDRKDPRSELHTNFRLDTTGAYLALVDRDGVTVLRQFPADYPATRSYARQRPDISHGLDAQGRIGFLVPPTPGASNGPVFAGVVEDMKATPERGVFDMPFTVELTTATAGATIRYSLDRSEPTATRGVVYTSPIPMSATTVLRAAAFKEGWAPTRVETHTYVFPSNVIASAAMRRSIT